MSGLQVRLSPRSRKDLKALPPDEAFRVIAALELLAVDPSAADIKKLQAAEDEWRLRVGPWRVRFRFDKHAGVIEVLRVLPRGRAYR